MADNSPDVENILLRNKHIKFFQRCINILPSSTRQFDTSRMTILFFAVCGLDVLDAMDTISAMKADIISWIYAQQVLPSNSQHHPGYCGFRGSGFNGASYKGDVGTIYNYSHIAMTYTALATLITLGDDLSRVDKPAVVKSLKVLQLDNGSFKSTAEESENDMRFVYCACCISHMLQDWSGIDTGKACQYIIQSQNYDYGIGQGPFLESHGGSTFCGIASLSLMGKLDLLSSSQLEGLKKWCIRRQQSGFQGRPHKPVDTCYSFWLGASLNLLKCGDMVEKTMNKQYVYSTQGAFTGGFAKQPDSFPDPLHSYLGLCGLSLGGDPSLQPICPTLNITQRAAEWLSSLHSK
ncbi:geranylgeranyl transferase type-1 subunit beta-like [Dysidea avara]|uniref:geranylgeranyl transferase type-1 subunit beta-like n=1 Tax=Dysidea avara TaxID=196820 RepID=UPI0033349F76